MFLLGKQNNLTSKSWSNIHTFSLFALFYATIQIIKARRETLFKVGVYDCWTRFLIGVATPTATANGRGQFSDVWVSPNWCPDLKSTMGRNGRKSPTHVWNSCSKDDFMRNIRNTHFIANIFVKNFKEKKTFHKDITFLIFFGFVCLLISYIHNGVSKNS